LVVIAIIGILASLLLTAISSAKRRTHIAVAKSEISAIKAALANYKSDMGRYPRLAARPTSSTDVNAYFDDCHALYAALRNRSTLESGGGQNAPYLEDWKPERIGFITTGYLTPAAMGINIGNQTMITRLPSAEIDQLNLLSYQKNSTHGPGSSAPLVLLDPWGNPYHYREWNSVRASFKDGMMISPTTRTPVTPPEGDTNVINSVKDLPHSPEAFDIWSNGPNGINEFGDPNSDDVTSWSQG
jgi:type II secretory pathway pseudopilin PulG